MLALLSTCSSVSRAPVAGMLGRMRTRCSPTIIYWFADTRAATSAGALWQWFTCSLLVGAELLRLLGPALEYLDFISEHSDVLLCHFGENQTTPSFFQCLNLLQWLSWWGFQEVFLTLVWRCNFQTVHISTDSHCRGALQPETVVSPRYSDMPLWSFLLQ